VSALLVAGCLLLPVGRAQAPDRRADLDTAIRAHQGLSGILASEALLRAADRGVQVRVIVDDLMNDAPARMLLALAAHPNVAIRIYNPVMTVGTPWYRRLFNILTAFRSVNQRMHDKTLIIEGELAITGGRNMADEYFDYDYAYDFRDRDALVMGAVVSNMAESF